MQCVAACTDDEEQREVEHCEVECHELEQWHACLVLVSLTTVCEKNDIVLRMYECCPQSHGTSSEGVVDRQQGQSQEKTQPEPPAVQR